MRPVCSILDCNISLSDKTAPKIDRKKKRTAVAQIRLTGSHSFLKLSPLRETVWWWLWRVSIDCANDIVCRKTRNEPGNSQAPSTLHPIYGQFYSSLTVVQIAHLQSVLLPRICNSFALVEISHPQSSLLSFPFPHSDRHQGCALLTLWQGRTLGLIEIGDAPRTNSCLPFFLSLPPTQSHPLLTAVALPPFP